MRYALMSGGGKNSTIALDRARRDGLDVQYLVSIYHASADRARIHFVPQALMNQHARSLGLKPVATRMEHQDLETAFDKTLLHLRELEVMGIVFGNIHLENTRAWYEERVKAAGLEHIEPIWGEPSIEVAWEVIERGYQALVVSVDLSQKATAFLGREFDADMVTEIGCMDGIDPSGEGGEYHTFVFDGPEFGRPLDFSVGDTFELERHRVIDLLPSDPS